MVFYTHYPDTHRPRWKKLIIVIMNYNDSLFFGTHRTDPTWTTINNVIYDSNLLIIYFFFYNLLLVGIQSLLMLHTWLYVRYELDFMWTNIRRSPNNICNCLSYRPLLPLQHRYKSYFWPIIKSSIIMTDKVLFCPKNTYLKWNGRVWVHFLEDHQ